MSSSEASKFTYVQNLTPTSRNVNLQFIVLEVGASRKVREGNADIRTVKVADPSGSINLCLWNDKDDAIQPGDIFRLKSGFCSVYKGCLVLKCSKNGDLIKSGEFFMAYSETPNVSEFKSEHLSLATTPQTTTSPAEYQNRGGGAAIDSKQQQQQPSGAKRPRGAPFDKRFAGGGGVGNGSRDQNDYGADDGSGKFARLGANYTAEGRNYTDNNNRQNTWGSTMLGGKGNHRAVHGITASDTQHAVDRSAANGGGHFAHSNWRPLSDSAAVRRCSDDTVRPPSLMAAAVEFDRSIVYSPFSNVSSGGGARRLNAVGGRMPIGKGLYASAVTARNA